MKRCPGITYLQRVEVDNVILAKTETVTLSNLASDMNLPACTKNCSTYITRTRCHWLFGVSVILWLLFSYFQNFVEVWCVEAEKFGKEHEWAT